MTHDDLDQRAPEEQMKAYAKGGKVHHPSFGLGVIRQCEKSSAGHRVTVQFQSGITKRLIAEFAGLVSLG